MMMLDQCGYTRSQIDEQVGRLNLSSHRVEELEVIFEVALLNQSHFIQIGRKDGRIFVNRAILNDGLHPPAYFDDLLQALVQKVHLQVERPSAHVVVKIYQIGIVVRRLKQRFPTVMPRQQLAKRGLSSTNIARNSDMLNLVGHSCVIFPTNVRKFNRRLGRLWRSCLTRAPPTVLYTPRLSYKEGILFRMKWSSRSKRQCTHIKPIMKVKDRLEVGFVMYVTPRGGPLMYFRRNVQAVYSLAFGIKNIESMTRMMQWMCIGLLSALGWSAMAQAQSSFEVEIVEEQFMSAPGVQSYAWGMSSDGKWLIIGGRIEGLHGFMPRNAFDPNYNNARIYVLDVEQKRVWSRSLAGLPPEIEDQLQSTNPEFVQVGGFLYFFGGYGKGPNSQNFITHPAVIVILVDEVVNAIIHNLDIKRYFHRVEDPRLAVTGGQVYYLDGYFYMMGGQRFDGRYNPMGHPSFTQEYTDAIRKFKLVSQGGTTVVSDYSEWKSIQHLHRRDYNAIPQIFPDGRKGFTMFTGVFQHNVDLPWLNYVDVFDDGFEVRDDTLKLSHYHSAKFGIWDSSQNTMHNIFFGGIAQFYYRNNRLVEDTEVPFVKTVSMVTRDQNWNVTEQKLDFEMPGYLGAGAEFIHAKSAEPYFHEHGVLVLDRLPIGKTLVGYIYGGIESSAPNIFRSRNRNLSSASNRIFKVYITRNDVVNNAQTVVRTPSPGLYPSPAPANGEVTLRINGWNCAPNSTVDIFLIEAAGKIVRSWQVPAEQMTNGEWQMSLQGIQPGSYLVRVKSCKNPTSLPLLIIEE